MPKSEIDRQIQARIEAFTNELTELVKQAALESISEALSGSMAQPPRGGRARRSNGHVASERRSNGVQRKGAKRSPEELESLADKLLKYVESNPGQRTEQIGAALDVPTKELALPMRKLIREGHLKTKGQKRATTYYAK